AYSCRGLLRQQRALALDAPAITGGRAVAAHHAVAGDRHGQRVGAAGLRHRAYRFRLAGLGGDGGIARGLARLDLAQRPPDLLLESGAAHVQRQIETALRRLDEADHLGDQLLEPLVAADELRLREGILQIAYECIGIVAELDRADALLGRRHQDRAE